MHNDAIIIYLYSNKINTRLIFVRGKDYHCVSGIRRHQLWAFSILPVGMVMCAWAVERDEIAFSDLSVAVHGQKG